MLKRILVNREECELRVAFLEEQSLVELHTEKFNERNIVNNIYRGRIQDVVPGLQAAFVDVGLDRNVFMHFMDVRPESLVLDAEDLGAALDEAAKTTLPGRIERKGRRPRQDPHAPQAAPPIKRGDNIIVQIVKDEIGGKAPRVTTNLSIPGRYLVLLPFPSQEGGVSRKIAVGQDRYRLKKLLASIKDDGQAFIVRTAGVDQPEEAIQQDAEYLSDMWAAIVEKFRSMDKPGLIHDDHDLLERMVRDAFPPDFTEVLCDHADDVEMIRTQIQRLMPDRVDRIKLYTGKENIFAKHEVEPQIEGAMNRKVWLKSGGSLIIDENEALTAIDVNTGRFTGKKDQEKTSLRTNMEACETIAQQIRLRDIGGIIVVDFIDMLSKNHQEQVSEELKRHLRHDRAKTAAGRIGDFGLMMLTRKRVRMSLQNQLFDSCPYCNGSGLILTWDEVYRRLKYDLRQMLTASKPPKSIVVAVHPRFLEQLSSRYKEWLATLRYGTKTELLFRADSDFHMEEYALTPMTGAERGGLRVSTRLAGVEGRGEEPSRHHYHQKLAGTSDRLNPQVFAELDVAAESGEVLSFDEVTSETAPLQETSEETRAGRMAEAATTSGVEPVSAEGGDQPGRSARKRRRRRESSAERRARRKRTREESMAEGETQEGAEAFDDDSDAPSSAQLTRAEEPMVESGPPKAAGHQDRQPAPQDQGGQRSGRRRQPRPPRREGEAPRQGQGQQRDQQRPQPQPTPAPPKPVEAASAPAEANAPEVKPSGRSGRRRRPRRPDGAHSGAPQTAPTPRAPLDQAVAGAARAIEQVSVPSAPKPAPAPSPAPAAAAEPAAPAKKSGRARKSAKRATKAAETAAAAPAKEAAPAAPKPSAPAEKPAAAKPAKRARKAAKSAATTAVADAKPEKKTPAKSADTAAKPKGRPRKKAAKSAAKKDGGASES